MEEKSTSSETSLRKSTISTIIVMGSTFLSRLLGFVRIAVIGAIFGTSGSADVLNAVFTIPNNLRKLLAEGAFSSAFIPVFSSALVKEPSGENPGNIVRNIISFQLVILVPLCLLSVVFAKPLMNHVFLEFRDPELLNLSISLFRWFISYILLISISSVLMGILNVHGKFFIPAFAPIFFSVAVITSILILHRIMGVFSMAVGVLSGGLLQIVFQLPLFRKLGYDFKPNFSFGNEYFKRIIRQWIPVLATASVFAVNQQIAVRFATGLTEGSTSALQYALVFFQLPFGIFSVSLTTVLFPRMSRQAASGDILGLRDTLQYGLRSLLVFLIPSSLFLIVLGKEIISVAMFRGEFTLEDTLLTSRVLFGYSLGLFSIGGFNFTQRFFYSLGEYRPTFYMALTVCVVDIILSIWLKETSLHVVGLALANTISFSLGFLLMIIIARKRLGHIEGRKILNTAFKIFVSAIPSIIFILGYLRITGDWWKSVSSIRSFSLLLGCGGGAILILIAMYYVTGVEMIGKLLSRRSDNVK
ncbi:MAG: murein biosynthesis integral membrane protein MurJ [Spirochaetes bacterium]|nr:MAG: murein biosynthesis integral membrane protein MurJ [Spirochaetota bacterium]